MRLRLFVGFAAAMAVSAGCSRKGDTSGQAPAPQVQNPGSVEPQPVTPDTAAPEGQVIVSSGALPLPKDDSTKIVLPSGDYVVVETIRGEQYIAVQAAMEDASFKKNLANARAQATNAKELEAALALPLASTIDSLGKQVGGLESVRTHAKYGYFSALMKLASYSSLQTVKLPSNIVLTAVVVSPMDERQVRKMDRALVDQALADARGNMDGFSGLVRMGIPEFLEKVKADLGGATPDGSDVTVGISDTGVTLNHPALTDANGNKRVKYLKDFTGEGRVYFNPAAKFTVSADAADASALNLEADVIPPTKGASSKPVADKFVTITKKIAVSDELKAILTTANNGAKLGILSEASFSSDTEKVDLNQNGKTDDNLLVILVPDGTSYKLYLAPVGLDFRKAAAVHNFNDAKETIRLGAEAFGFEIKQAILKDSTDAEVKVMSASIVGFDAGNHGTHVSGIIAGRKTIANDSDATLARGGAPNVSLMVNRVCANNGGCDATEAVIDLAENGAEVINMSLGGLGAYNDGYSAQEVIIDRLTEMENVLFVISAGNSGPGINTIGSPSTGRLALSVGATASRSLIERQYQWPARGKLGPDVSARKDDDFMLFFSSRGPTAAGGFKPNVSAPGTELSSVQLNAAPGQRAGLDVYWGTSMAAPSATGAIALLLDTAKKYNALHADAPLPLDALTLRKVIVASAKPFDVTRFDLSTGDYTRGQYTWIDQGTGMVNLPRAWDALKAERDSRVPSGVFGKNGDKHEEIRLDYQVRVLRTSPNGLNYDGSIAVPPELLKQSGPRFGRGIWLSSKETDSLIPVQIARRLPTSAQARDDAGDLKRLLVDTKDEFLIKTVIYGSKERWVKAGSMNQENCTTAPAESLTVLGEGATDDFEATNTPRSIAQRESTLYVCIDRGMTALLPAGDHGALIMMYRKDGDKVESNPEVIVPVYITIPNKTLAGAAGYEVNSTVQAFGVARNYVDVPEGVSLVSVTLEVPAATVDGTVVTNCQGVKLYAYEAGNTLLPAELDGAKAIASNCDDNGRPTPGKRTVTYSRTNPKAGLWDLHVFGRYTFELSNYKLSVQYAKVKASVDLITGGPEALDGAVNFDVLDASFAAKPSSEKSTLEITGLKQELTPKIKQDEQLMVPDADGKVARTYGANVTSVTITTGGAPGNDLDLAILECTAADLANCAPIGQSAGATDVEKVTFAPVAGKFYAALVIGYDVSTGDGTFAFGEERSVKTTEKGAVSAEDLGGDHFKLSYSFDQDASALLKDELFASGKYALVGALTVRTDAGSIMTSLPVKIQKPAAAPLAGPVTH